MPRFTVISPDAGIEPEEFVAGDSGQVLGLVHRLGWHAADVRQDGEYLFSISLNNEGVWSIIRKQQPMLHAGQRA
jgi:hypothetical protein